MIHLSLGVGNNTWRNGNATYYLGAACMHTKDTDVFAVVSRNDWFLVCHTRGLFPMPHCQKEKKITKEKTFAPEKWVQKYTPLQAQPGHAKPR